METNLATKTLKSQLGYKIHLYFYEEQHALKFYLSNYSRIVLASISKTSIFFIRQILSKEKMVIFL